MRKQGCGNEAFLALSGTYVFLAEDEALIALEVASLLEETGCEVLGPFARLPEALNVAATERIDLAVLDVNLKEASVWPVADLLQKRRVPFVFLTGYSKEEQFPPQFAHVRRLEKPFVGRHLLATLADLLDLPPSDCRIAL